MGKIYLKVIHNIGQVVTLISTFLHNELIRTMGVSINKQVTHFLKLLRLSWLGFTGKSPKRRSLNLNVFAALDDMLPAICVLSGPVLMNSLWHKMQEQFKL